MRKFVAFFLVFCMLMSTCALAKSDFVVISASSSAFSVKTEDKWKASPSLKGPGGAVRYTNIQDEWAKWSLDGVSGEQDLYYYLLNHTDGKNDAAARLEVFCGGEKYVYTVDHNANPTGWYKLGTFTLDGTEEQYIRLTRIGASYGYYDRVESVGYASAESKAIPVQGELKGNKILGYTTEDEQKEQQKEQVQEKTGNVFVSADQNTVIVSPVKDGDGKTLFGAWGKSGALKDYNEDSTYYTATTGDKAVYEPHILKAGRVRVLFYNLFFNNNNQTITVRIHTDSGVHEEKVVHSGLRVSGWHDMGVFEFGGSGKEFVELVKGEEETTVNTRVGSVMFQLSPDTQELPQPMEREAERVALPADAPPVPAWAMQKTEPFNAGEFEDTKTHWAKATIENLVRRGIVNGKSAHAFEPDASVTNAELATMFLNLLQLPVGKEGGAWYDAYIDGAKAAGLLENTAIAEAPEQNADRLTLAKILYNTLKIQGKNVKLLPEFSGFPELDALGGADTDAVKAVVSAKLMIGSNGQLKLFDAMTRAEAVTVMERILKLSVPAVVQEENGYILQNLQYKVQVEQNGDMTVTYDGKVFPFRARGTVIYSVKSPDLKQQNVEEERVTYNIPSWTLYGSAGGMLGEAHEFHKMESKVEGRTENLFAAGESAVYDAFSVTASETEIILTGQADAYGTPVFTLSLEQGKSHPKLKMAYTFAKDGYYTFGFTGFAAYAPEMVEEIWQPMVWTEKRFPLQAYLTPEYHLPTAGTAYRKDGYTVFYAVAQEDLPFKIPTYENSRYGAAIRNQDGLVQPQIFAPFYGSSASNKKSGEQMSLLTEISVYKGKIEDVLPELVEDNYGYYDFRTNGNISMNEVIENMIGYGMHDYYSKFMPDYKGFSYENDAPGTTKNVSAVHPSSLALVFDDKNLYDRRGLPLSEYMMSRNDLTYKYVETASQGSNALGTPSMKMNEYAALYQMSGNTVKAFYDKMNEKAGAAKTDWKQAMVYYKATGDSRYLDIARSGADKYIEDRLQDYETDYKSISSSWWHFFCPDYVELYEMFNLTGDRKYLDAAHIGARRFAMFLWYTPGVPDGKTHINPNNEAPKYAYNRGIMPMEAAEKDIDAWLVSEIGLHAEAAFTSHGHRGIFMAFHAPYFMKIGADTGDEFLKSIARHAVVGRYENFPGYHINTGYTDVYMQKDYPFKTYEQLTYNSFHYNHIWPHATMLLDFLYADVYEKTNGLVETNGIYVDSYAYVKTHAYGALPGKFYDVSDAYPYMPEKAITISNPQLNYASYRADNKLCIAFTNQSKKDVAADVVFNTEKLPIDKSKTYRARVFVNNTETEAITIQNGAFSLNVPKGGVYAMIIEDVQITPVLKPPVAGALFGESSTDVQPTTSGNLHAMVLGFGEGTETVYIYLDGTPAQAKALEIRYTVNGETKTQTDNKHPFECTLPYGDDFKFSAKITALDGTVIDVPERTIAK